MKPPRPGVRITGHTIEMRSREAIAELITLQEAAGEGFRVPLFRAAQAGALVFAITGASDTRIPARILKRNFPTAVILADDHPAATGPEAWPQARQLVRWAKAIAIHATGGQPEHYALFAKATMGRGRLLIIEIEHHRLEAWLALVSLEHKPADIFCVLPRPGGQHPVRPAEAGEVLH